MNKSRIDVLQSILIAALVLLPLVAGAQPIPYGYGAWDADTLGNHRVVLRVDLNSDAVVAHIPWRRRDRHPETKQVLVVDARTNERIRNVSLLTVTREAGDLIFQPVSGPGEYWVYYLPYIGSKRSNYPKITYAKPDTTADTAWLTRNGVYPSLDPRWTMPSAPHATVLQFQAIDTLNSFWPMEVIATAAETENLVRAHPLASYLVFPEDRSRSIRMTDDIPMCWAERGAGGKFSGSAERGEFYAFQLGVFAARGPARDVRIEFGDLRLQGGDPVIRSEAFRCFNLGGVDNAGKDFVRSVSVDSGKVQAFWCGVQIPADATPGIYGGQLTVLCGGGEPTQISLAITVSNRTVTTAGDDEPDRLSRLRWLDSRLAFDDDPVPPFPPLRVTGRMIHALGRAVRIGQTGFPDSIISYFAEDMTRLSQDGHALLTGPVAVTVHSSGDSPVALQHTAPSFTKRSGGAVAWKSQGKAENIVMDVEGEMEFDGTMEFTVVLRSSSSLSLQDVRLTLPIDIRVAQYMLGLGRKGGGRPGSLDWTWDVSKNQDGAWLGTVNAGLQFSLRDNRYSRPLNTNFYTLKPLVMPASWYNDGKGGVRFREKDGSLVVTCFSGPRRMQRGDTLWYNFRLVVTPFRTIDTDSQWRTRYYHRYRPVEEIAATGANVINVHHATPINPYINYPFFRPIAMKAYADSAHRLGMKMKIYYTVRELTNRAPELFALRSLGHEIFAPGSGGGFSWLQEHLGGDYIAAWFVPELKDAAIINSGVSRWHNFYVEGVNWLAKNAGIDGLYIDDVAFDRLTMKRIRKVLMQANPGALIDLHSANQFNVRDGFVNSAYLYLEHFPYIDRLWFGEYFDYDSPPDYWLTEVSGIPFGVMGEMLEKGGNPWRGMIYGMTSRLPWAGDPRPIWKVWDEFGMEGSRMIGYWVEKNPVRTDQDSVLATLYVKKGSALLALASWASARRDVRLLIDWTSLGIDPRTAAITAPEVENFQPGREFALDEPVPVEPGKGWMLLIRRGE